MVWLKAIRESKNLSQEEISKAVDITQASYSNIENGKRTPSVPVAKKIAAVLGFDWTRFYDEAEAGEQDSADEKAACRERDCKRLEEVLAMNFEE